jgi:hypothetical protein
MAELDPAISLARERDARVKPAHDDFAAIVMAGLDPAISLARGKDVPVKPAHDVPCSHDDFLERPSPVPAEGNGSYEDKAPFRNSTVRDQARSAASLL